MRATYRRPSLFWPFLLVVVGIIFLLNNIGVMPGSFWDVAIRFWPVLLILAGLDSIYRGEGFAGAAFFTGLGVIFLLINLGYIGWSILDILIRFWPVFLILLGIDIIFSRYRGSVWANLVALLLMIAIIGGVIFIARTQALPGGNLTAEQIQHPLNGADQANVQISIPVGSLTIHPTTDASQFMAGTVRLAPGEHWKENFNTNNQSISYTLNSEGVGAFASPRGSNNSTFDLGFNPAPTTRLTINIGAGECNISTNGMNLSQIKVNFGIGKCTIQLPAATNYQANIEGAIGETVLILPANQPARIHLSNGISGLQIPSGFRRQGEEIFSPTYANAANAIEIEAGQAIGNLRIETTAQ